MRSPVGVRLDGCPLGDLIDLDHVGQGNNALELRRQKPGLLRIPGTERSGRYERSMKGDTWLRNTGRNSTKEWTENTRIFDRDDALPGFALTEYFVPELLEGVVSD